MGWHMTRRNRRRNVGVGKLASRSKPAQWRSGFINRPARTVGLDDLIRERVREELLRAIEDSHGADDLALEEDRSKLSAAVEGGVVRLDIRVRTSVPKALTFLFSLAGLVGVLISSLPDPGPVWNAVANLIK